MNRQHGAWRLILGALVVMVAAATSLGTGHSARAEDNGWKVFDHGSKANFQSFCKQQEGTFSEDGLGNTKCTHKDGGYRECDANGNDCWYVPPSRQAEPEDPFDPYNGGEGEVADDPEGSEPPAPVADSPTAPDAQPTVSTPDDDQEQDASNAKGKKSKKGKKGGKGRKK